MEEINLDRLNMADTPSVNFGGGIELLMNDKKKMNTGEHISLEDELRDLDNLGKNDTFKFEAKPIRLENRNINLDKKDAPIFIGKETVNMDTQNQAPDGFKHIDNIPLEEAIKNIEHKSKEDILREKFQYLRKLETLEGKGVNLSKRYTMESSLDEMKGEYEYIIAEKEQKNSKQFQGKVLTTLITGLEFLNGKFDPFDIKLDGWSEQINENIDDYDEIFAELHDKYKSKAKMAPELKILFQLAASGMMIHMTNTMFKSAIPGMDDIMRQNPDLMNQFTKAAVNSMENTSPGVAGFMNEFKSKPMREEMRQQDMHQQDMRPQREEMRGPDNINTILSGLNKKIDLNDRNESTISVEELDSMSNIPTSRRKRRSDKNTIRLDV
jgi:hypothetical protein